MSRIAIVVVGLWAVPACLTGCSVASSWGKPKTNVPLGARFVESAVPIEANHNAVVDRQAVAIETQEVDVPPAAFRIGAGDKLHINVNGEAELSTVVPGGRGGVMGARVDGNGEIQLPVLGRVQVQGKTTAELQDLLVEKYAKYIKEHWVIVEILEHRSQPVYLVGQFNEPGVIYMDRQTNMLQAIARGRGMAKDAYLRGARLLRDDQVLAVDIYELLNGAMDQNVWLWPEDTIFVPSDADQKVFVLGDVGRPGAVDMEHGRLTLSKAIALAEGFNRVGNAVDRIHLIRSLSPTRGELIVIDLTKILHGEALPFALMPGDVVYLPRTKGGKWNDAVEAMMPTMQAIGLTVGSFAQVLFATRVD